MFENNVDGECAITQTIIASYKPPPPPINRLPDDKF